ncbi:MAG: ATP-binding protein [Pseudomonadota bacterium]
MTEAETTATADHLRFIQSLPVAAAMFDREMRYLAHSDQWVEDYRLHGVDLIGRSHYDVFPEIPERWREIHQRNLRGEQLSMDDDPFHRADGRVDYVSWTNAPWTTPDGAVGGVIMVTKLTTETALERSQTDQIIAELETARADLIDRLARRRRELEESRRQLATFIDNMPGGAFQCLVDADWTMLFMSEGCHRVTGYPVDEMVRNRRVTNQSIIHPDDRAGLRNAIDAATAENRPYEHTYRIRTKAGRERHVWERGLLTDRSEDGVPIIEGIMLDVTDRRRAEIARADALAQLESANRAKSRFLANMSHELRTPLNAIIGFSEVISKQMFGAVGNDKYLEYAGLILRSGEHLSHLVNDILDVSKIEAGEFRPQPESFALRPVLEEVTALFSARAPSSADRFHYDCAPAIDAIYMDPRNLRQILINLLSNADKFTPDDGAIRIAAAIAEDGGWTLTVADDGAGISETDLDRVFEPFAQARDRMDVSHGGTGLGLTLSKQLVELNGGTLTLTSAVGRGTTVTLRFPAETLR